MTSLSVVSLFGGGTGTGAADLLATLQGRGGTRISAISPLVALRSAERNRDRDIGRTASQPDIQRTIDRFRTGVARASSADALLRDPRVMEVLLTANGLGDQTGRPALARQALLSDPSDPNALISRLPDTRWKAVAQTFDFARRGLDVIRDPRVIDQIAGAYAEVKWRQSLDETTPGLSNALTFRARAASVPSALHILGDPVLREVVTVALDIPKQIAFQSLEAQQAAITSRLPIDRLQDPKFVEAFAQRYLLKAAEKARATDGPDLTTLAIRSAGLLV